MVARRGRRGRRHGRDHAGPVSTAAIRRQSVCPSQRSGTRRRGGASTEARPCRQLASRTGPPCRSSCKAKGGARARSRTRRQRNAGAGSRASACVRYPRRGAALRALLHRSGRRPARRPSDRWRDDRARAQWPRGCRLPYQHAAVRVTSRIVARGRAGAERQHRRRGQRPRRRRPGSRSDADGGSRRRPEVRAARVRGDGAGPRRPAAPHGGGDRRVLQVAERPTPLRAARSGRRP